VTSQKYTCIWAGKVIKMILATLRPKILENGPEPEFLRNFEPNLDVYIVDFIDVWFDLSQGGFYIPVLASVLVPTEMYKPSRVSFILEYACISHLDSFLRDLSLILIV
jgi:hypothetical protein